MLIGLTGLAGSGKTAVYDILHANFGFQRVKWADPLKNMCRSLIRDVGYSDFDVERYVEGDLKEQMIPELGITARFLMQTLGTEWGRDAVRPTFWVDIWNSRVDDLAGANALADDTRFPNEVEAIRARGGQVWRVERPGITPGEHPSERYIAELAVDRVIRNTGTLLDLHVQVMGAASLVGFRCRA